MVHNNLDLTKYLLGKKFIKKSESKYYLKTYFYNQELQKRIIQQYKEWYPIVEVKEFYSINKEQKKLYMSLFNSREKEHAKFLLLVNIFFGNDKPIIVTEGKPIQRYIKAALKNLMKIIPNLVKKMQWRFYI